MTAILDKPATHPDRREEALLQVSNVSRRFASNRHDTTALQDVSLSIREGEFVCVVGPSGCGKSTLLNLIAGLDRPTAGRITFDGHAVEGAGVERVVVFQEPALYPWMNVRGNVEFGLKMRASPGANVTTWSTATWSSSTLATSRRLTCTSYPAA